MSETIGSKSYVGLSGEVVTAYDEAGRQFLAVYERLCQSGIENSAAGMQMLAQIIHAAGGEVRVAFRGLGTLRKIEFEVTQDIANNDLVFRTKSKL